MNRYHLPAGIPTCTVIIYILAPNVGPFEAAPTKLIAENGYNMAASPIIQGDLMSSIN
jgi:hypothetical protein